MNNFPLTFKMGRENGHTEFPDSDVMNSHYFRYYMDPRRVPYGDRNILAVIEVRENGNNIQSKVRFLGVYDKGQYRFSKSEVSVSLTKDSIVEGPDIREDIERVLREEYRTEGEILFS